MNNERGGIISKMLIIPIGVAFMAGFFFLGYYVGKYQSKTNQNEIVVPLPDLVSQNLPKKEEFTFFKTLTDRENKTVSIELKPKLREEAPVQKKDAPQEQKKDGEQKKEKKPEPPKADKREQSTAVVKGPEPKPQTAKKEPVITRSPGPRMRYTLQISSYQEKDMAEADVKKMKQRGYAAFMIASEIEGKGKWYRVRVGSLPSRAAAEKLQKEMRSKEGITPFITLE